jgi:hypothetical protein
MSIMFNLTLHKTPLYKLPILLFLEAKFISGCTVRVVGYTEQTQKEKVLLPKILKDINMS